MIDLQRPNELHAQTTEGHIIEWDNAIEIAWPAVSALLTLLEEFSRRVRESSSGGDAEMSGFGLVADIDWLESEMKKEDVRWRDSELAKKAGK